MPSVYASALPPVNATARQTTQNFNAPRRMLHTSEPGEPAPSEHCAKCSQQHQLKECRQFKALSVRNRWECVKQHRLCFSCLQVGHNLINCQSRQPCGIDACSRMHNPLLHQAARATPMPVEPKPDTVSSQSQVNTHMLSCLQNNTTCLFKILPFQLSGPKSSVTVYAMMDEGSSVTLLEDSVADILGVRGRSAPLTLQWYNDKQTTEKSRMVNLEIRGSDSTSYQLKNVRTVKHLDLPVQSFRKDTYSHLASSCVADYDNVKPALLIGLDNSFLCTSGNTVAAGPDKPMAAVTKLGWVAYGPTDAVGSASNILHVRQSFTDLQLHQLVEEYFSFENFGVKQLTAPLESNEDSRARKILEETTTYVDQRYEVGLLWREDHILLPPSYDMAKRRLTNIEHKMAKDATYAASYKTQIANYIKKGYAQQLTPYEAQQHTATTWYLPHFGVVNPNKPNKMRIVFDAAAVASNTSLNSVLLKGPDHAQPLLAIMHKFRQRQIAVAGDIEEMFSQVKIRSADRNAQRFLWRDGNQSEPIRVYVMSSMIFGATCSPCCAEHIKNRNVEQFVGSMPRGTRAVMQNTYVDDLVISFDNAQEAAEVVHEAIAINAHAGFKLRNFVSNCKQLQSQLNGHSIMSSNVIKMDHASQTDKILGMYWNSEADVLEFHFKFYKICREVIDGIRAPTKRELLALAMAIYDPFGLIANATVTVKILLQSTWKQQIDWDDPLPTESQALWFAWWQSFQQVQHLKVARCYSPHFSTAEDAQLHVFVDASEAAYAAVAYIRISQFNNTDVAFVAAKSRCAPKRELSIPRLELQAAVLGSRLIKVIEESLERKISSVTFWSDSKTVILWIRSTKRNYKQFVANRISEILENTSPTQWRWIPSSLNVADEATKLKPSLICRSDSRWISGPSFLKANETDWPVEPPQLCSEDCAKEESKKGLLLIASRNVHILEINKFSSYLRLLRVTAWVKRFAENLKSKPRQRGELTAEEVNNAEKYICRQAQRDLFQEEVNILRNKRCLPKSSSLYQLTPKLDEEGILRINGRIDAAYCLPHAARHPIILPNGHHLAHLVMDHFHRKRHHQNDQLTINEMRQRFWIPRARGLLKLVKRKCPHFHRKRHHQNDQLTINEMRQRFWIPRARGLLKSVKRKCPTCIRSTVKPAVPLMGQLPPDRLTPYVRPFSYAGVDYCGPFFVAIGRRREKRWVALFTCLTTRAVHIEIAEDLSADAFIICLRNFINRRGVPTRIRSDNGTNFIGAQRELEKDQQIFDFDAVQREAAKDRIEWVFNCPANPAAGGCWERLVQCVKRILQRVLKNEAPRIETFRSVLMEAENIVNSRPLTDIPVTPDDPEPLTPNHFLLGCLGSTQTPSPSEENACLRKQWRIAQNLKNRFWKRWIDEYLPQLLIRSKWRDEVKPLQVGQLVIVCDPQLPRSQWQTGRIIDVITAKDGQVRSATVRTSHGTIRRPTCKLAALEL